MFLETMIGSIEVGKLADLAVWDRNPLQVETDVSEANIEKIAIGQPCEIALDAYPLRRYAGSVAKIVPTADRAKATVLVKVAFRDYDERVLPEMSAKVQFLQQEAKAPSMEQPVLMLPVSAISTRLGQATVYKVVDGRAAAVPVTIGDRYGGYVAILSGLAEGEAVIGTMAESVRRAEISGSCEKGRLGIAAFRLDDPQYPTR